MTFTDDPRTQKPVGNGKQFQISAPYAYVYDSNKLETRIATQALFGEIVMAYQESDNKVKVQLVRDGYVGWVEQSALSTAIVKPDSKISARLSVAYELPNLKSLPVTSLSMGALVLIEKEENDFGYSAESGWIYKQHYKPINSFANDPVDIARKFLNAPYQWGGRDSRGLDCSGLVQQAFEACNITLPRDTDMQFSFGRYKIDWTENIEPQRNDLIFWKGHVAIVADKSTIIHSTARHMAVVEESLYEVVKRIAESEGLPLGLTRYRIENCPIKISQTHD